MNIRRVLLDVDKAIQRPEIVEIARAIDALFRAIDSTGWYRG